MGIMAETKTIVNGINISTDKRNKIAYILLKVEVRNLGQLDYIMKRINNIKGINEVRRVRTLGRQVKK